MKKTVSVNIKGTNFLIEEDAYELLQDYLDRLNNALKNELGSKEIIEDVELRIAELCSAKMSEFKTVVELEDIQDILETLGDPSMYLDDEEDIDSGEKFQSKSTDSSNERRLFRDTENAVIGGVCQGIANFMNIDVVVVRAIFVVILLFAGFGFPLYVILWIIVPKTKSMIDRLRMKGRPITVESVRDEVESAAERLKDKSSSFASSIRDNQDNKRRFSRIGRIISVIFGVGLIIWGLTWLVMFLIFIIGGFQFIPLLSEDGMVSLTEFGELVLASPGDIPWAWIGGLMGGFSIILFLLLIGSSLIFKLRNKWTKMALGGLFTTAFIGGMICAYLGFKSAVDVSLEGEVEKEIATLYTDQLTLLPELNTTSTNNGFKVKSNGRNGLMKISEKEIQQYGIDIVYRESKDSLYHVYQNLSARAKSNKKGIKRAGNIKHDFRIVGDSIYIDTDYRFPREDKIRDQRVNIIIEIPTNKSVSANGNTIMLGRDNEDEETDAKSTSKHGTFYGDGDYESHRDNW